ncbi:NmrA family NAD(P)-binding protein [Hymenobacter sp. PAMC 26628]|uniref:NmrA family NAD(P)-binding protein n=1 Tax=Hymenobacter sp. PAMC 26628 TaxID=1484118 RepID=UPI0007705212|nr:NAD(P)H-binding protein [Hymenobacter sp. PAMC 26628]AMJ67783.1 NAD-dependent dehydratase [Hymenobacter sp. PAMC 26628]
MNIIVTGSLGNVSGPLTETLVRNGHRVTVISSDPAKVAQINRLGAAAAIGSLTDAAFLRQTFTGAEALYAMIPFSFTAQDQSAYLREIATNYVQAIQHTGIKRAVLLSGWAADLVPSSSVEDVFAPLTNVAVTFLRPAYFYSNFYMSLPAIRQTGQLTATYGGDDRLVFVSPQDIAAVAAEELVSAAPSSIRYVGSDEMTCNEAARLLGAAIGVPALHWTVISPEQMLAQYKGMGMPATFAQSLVDMEATMHDGTALANFHRANPPLGTVKLAEFAQEFAVAYQAH